MEKFWSGKSGVFSTVNTEEDHYYIAANNYRGQQPSRPLYVKLGFMRLMQEKGTRHYDVHQLVWNAATQVAILADDKRFKYDCAYNFSDPKTNRNIFMDITGSWEVVVCDVPIYEFEQIVKAKKEVGFAILNAGGGVVASQDIDIERMGALQDFWATIPPN